MAARELRSGTIRSGAKSAYSSGILARLTHTPRKPTDTLAITSQRFDDRQHAVEVGAKAGIVDRALQHRRRAIRENAGSVAGGFQGFQRDARVGEGVELEIGAQQIGLERFWHRRHPRQRVIERALGQCPEIHIVAGERQRPGVFKLFRAPQVGHAVGVGSGSLAKPADRCMHVE
jgi:hypothetical protein